nr:polysaccharide pyruvyl transferase family protein [Ornithinimicrobium cryptoxanthini]
MARQQTLESDAFGPPRVFVALAADYGNLGDLAITYAQEHFLQEIFPEAIVELLPISQTLPAIAELRQAIRPQDVITLVGGGNTGDMYDDIQYLRELVIRSFPRTRIVSFPQTIDFSETFYGRWARRQARRAYNRHGDLTIFARDTRSLRTAKQLFAGCTVRLAPDVVLTLDRTLPTADRQGVVVALRSDLERGLNDAEHATIEAVARQIDQIRKRDTHLGDVRVTARQAEVALNHFWGDLRSARLVITDRLHGMIFSVITGTPCVVFDSGTGKVEQFYDDWLKDQPQVALLQTGDEEGVEAACRAVIASIPPTVGWQDTFAKAFGSWAVPEHLRD